MSMSGMSDMSGMTSSSTAAPMSGMSMSSTASAANSASTGMSGMSGMSDHSMAMGGNCKISMLWNWNTIDACFLSSGWHITSKGMFAGTCIAIIILVIALEFLRRAGKEYDRYLVASYRKKNASRITSYSSSSTAPDKAGIAATVRPGPAGASFRPTVPEQAIRALLHMVAFAVAYFVMLLAMYFNGYIIISIFIGAFIGFFIFGWETVSLEGPREETTVCCG